MDFDTFTILFCISVVVIIGSYEYLISRKAKQKGSMFDRTLRR